MDIFSFLALVIITGAYLFSSYLEKKSTKEFFDKLMEKFSEKQVVSLPWEQAVDNPEAQMKDADHIPLEEFDEDEMKEKVKHMFTVQEKDTEAEEAQKEVN